MNYMYRGGIHSITDINQEKWQFGDKKKKEYSFRNHPETVSAIFDLSIIRQGPSWEPWFKVCHSSALQTTSVRSVYIKILNCSGRILANLNNTMRTKQHTKKNTTFIFKYKQDILGNIFCGRRVF